MKPPPFTYHDPATLDEAYGLLATLENARVLSGGQSLIPMLNFRYVQPDHIIDVAAITAISGIDYKNGTLKIGAMTRQREIEFSEIVAKHCPLMTEAILQVGHRQTRNRGTIGGSLAHLDPAAELPLVACAMDATIHIGGKRGLRDVAFPDYALGFMTTAIEPDEMVTGVSLKTWTPGHGSAFVEFARREGDFAIVAVATLLEVDAAKTITRASLAIGGALATAQRNAEAEAILVGAKATEETFRAAGEACTRIDAMEDVHAPASYRKSLAGVLARRALKAAAEKANTRT
jgi:carbon-monoxide dehydrogenase medium subunit